MHNNDFDGKFSKLLPTLFWSIFGMYLTARPETPLSPSLSALAFPQADRSAPQASLPGQFLFLTPGLDV